MDAESNPTAYNQVLVEARSSWSDEAVLAELKALPVLPDEDDPAWNDARIWKAAALYDALADVAATRQLHAAIPLLLERACYGDPYEMMRGLRHKLEAIVNPNWAILTPMCMEAATYPQRGARLWAVAELGILRDPLSLQILIAALADEADEVRMRACSSLEMLCQANESCRIPAIAALIKYLDHYRADLEVLTASEALTNIQNMD
jgi:hypothetical protein